MMAVPDIMLLMFLFVSANFLVSTLCFARVSVRFIDSKLESMGTGKPMWDGIGIRITIYALVILSQWFAKTPLVAGQEIRTIARIKDKYLAYWYNVSSLLFIVSGLLIYILLPD